MEEHKYSPRDFSFYFGEAYLAFFEQGLITVEQLDRMTTLLDMMETLPPELFCERLKRIFPEDIEDEER